MTTEVPLEAFAVYESVSLRWARGGASASARPLPSSASLTWRDKGRQRDAGLPLLQVTPGQRGCWPHGKDNGNLAALSLDGLEQRCLGLGTLPLHHHRPRDGGHGQEQEDSRPLFLKEATRGRSGAVGV